MAKMQSARKINDVVRTSAFPLIFWNCFTLFWFSHYCRRWQPNLNVGPSIVNKIRLVFFDEKDVFFFR